MRDKNTDLESKVPYSCKIIDSLLQEVEYPCRINKENFKERLEELRKINSDLRLFAEKMADRVEQLEDEFM